MFQELKRYATKPELYAPGTHPFWNDAHISKGLLAAHLNPEWDAATRKPEFLERSVKWISEIASPVEYSSLLDIGCGPGLYAERFSDAGYAVTGVDFSERSIAYANEQTALNKSNIKYICQNYLTIDYKEQFDVVTLIYCDYAVLSVADRLALLRKVHQALKPGGKFIFDVFAPMMRKKESHTWDYEDSGFYSDKPHICMESVYQYDDEDKTELGQYIVITEDGVKCFHIWDHYFTKDALISEAEAAGFHTYAFYGDVAGKEYSEAGETICGVFTK